VAGRRRASEGDISLEPWLAFIKCVEMGGKGGAKREAGGEGTVFIHEKVQNMQPEVPSTHHHLRNSFPLPMVSFKLGVPCSPLGKLL